MLRERKYYRCLIAMLLCSHMLLAQQTIPDKLIDTAATSSSMIVVGDIILSGNKKTKEAIILREILFKKGDQYPLDVLVKKMEEARRQLMNTALFNAAIIAAKNIEGNKIDILVEVKERWYLFPVPVFRPVDRNLNQWLVEQSPATHG